MHQMSINIVNCFAHSYLASLGRRDLRILEVGSMDKSELPQYRSILKGYAEEYIGLDISQGPNVDLVVEDAYSWFEIAPGSFDLVISGQTYEHIERPWITTFEISRVLKLGGIFMTVAPSKGSAHWGPKDCWRIYPDGFKSLAEYAMLDTLEASAIWQPDFPDNWLTHWGDCFLVAQKPSDLDQVEFRSRYKGAKQSSTSAKLLRVYGHPEVESNEISVLSDCGNAEKVADLLLQWYGKKE